MDDTIPTDPLVIRQVPHGGAEYWATVALRDAVLRKPLGLRFTPEELDREDDSIHLACYQGSVLAGCLILRPRTGGDVQMRQVAVDSSRQVKGIGTALVRHAEALARQQGFRRMVLHARDVAAAFYEKLGYTRLGDPFEEVGLPHWEMHKGLEEPETRRATQH